MLRFASSPTKEMTLSDLRVAIFNYILSKQLNKDLVVRIDDTQKEKLIEGKDKEILEILSLFSIDYKFAVHQSDSLKYHQKLAMQLMAQKKAFSCFCSDEKLKELEQKAKKEGKLSSYDGFCETLSDETVLNTNAPFTVRMKKPDENIKFTDTLKGDFEFTPDEIDSFHILTHDKTPTYNYACALDDMIMNISTVIRLDDYLEDTPRQIYIRKLLGYDLELEYIHLPKISNTDDIKSIKSLIDEGFLPSAIANYLVSIGNETPSEIFTLEEASQWFDIKKVSKDSAVFDIEELKAINKKHLETIDNMRLSKILGFADEDIGKLGKLFLNDSSTIKQIKDKIDLVFSQKDTLPEFKEEFKQIKECIKNAPYIDNFNDFEKYISEQTKLNDKALFKPLAYILTGREDGENISDIYPLIKNYLGEIVK